MSQITIVPVDQVVVISGVAASGVDMTSVAPAIHALQFNTELGRGTVEFKADPETGTIHPLEQITSVDPWQQQIIEAEQIIFCKQNPETFYSTVTPVGRPTMVSEKGWPQPANTTKVPPPSQPSTNTVLYWDSTEFVWSVFPVDIPLAEAQEYVTNLVNSEAYTILQPSDWYVIRQSNTGVPVPESWDEWRTFIRSTANDKRLEVDSKESLSDLETYCESEEFQYWPPSP